MQNGIAVFRSMLSAVAYVLGDNADHHFEMVENTQTRAFILADISSIPAFTPEQLADPLAAGIASTFVDFALGEDSTVAGVTLGSEAHYGFILSHYTREGEIIRFVAFRA